jgi:hydroxymethylglutaryl-CoA lyase
VDAVISCAFGSPFEGDVAPRTVAAMAGRLLGDGATSVTLADTTGLATPRRINEVLDATGSDVGLHLHDTRGTALLNAYAALARGVTRLDTALGGLGGSPFASGSGSGGGGNLATEDLVYLLDDLGIGTGVSFPLLLAAGEVLAALVGHRLPSRVRAAALI